MLLLDKQLDLGVAELEKAVSGDPNFSWAYAMLALGLDYSGSADEAIGFAKKAIRLDPKCEAWVAYPLGLVTSGCAVTMMQSPLSKMRCAAIQSICHRTSGWKTLAYPRHTSFLPG
jgi:tetratricopeptide (TPR) repeat protein